MSTLNPIILLVEDNADDEDLTCRVLAANARDHSMVVIRDGRDALDHIEQGARAADAGPAPDRLPRLVLLDLNLPRVNGFAVLQAMRQLEGWRRIPVVVLSTSHEPLDVERCYDLGCNSFVQKPVEFDRFREVVGLIGRYWLAVNTAAAGAEASS